ncbi:MAG: tRNA (adenosine(37)-N6)-threonylcarbamoyltransferase complex transferase subunit TsaD [Cytophagales bacterium]|nr:tRNA (adenosine(37)-N6)-threonylcarbamoyltransferase complex transferase subunit TsaD [Cytophagales bacterium]
MSWKTPCVVLGIETSCDETSVALWDGFKGRLLSNITLSQEIHKLSGGVIPERASRSHEENILPLVESVLRRVDLPLSDLCGIACTQGPGLFGSLAVGFMFAKGLSWALGLPFIPVNHLEAHVASLFLDPPYPPYPFLCLLASGGHSLLLRVEGPFRMEILGRSLDDAVGEAFDKTAKMMGLPYPGGVEIDKFSRGGDPHAYSFPSPRVDALNYSFSGLKTAFLYFLEKKIKAMPKFVEENLEDLCASIQEALLAHLLSKLEEAVEGEKIYHVGLVGGVAANHRLRELLSERPWAVYSPAPMYCTDNGAMVALAGHWKQREGILGSWEDIPFARSKIGSS